MGSSSGVTWAVGAIIGIVLVCLDIYIEPLMVERPELGLQIEGLGPMLGVLEPG